MQIPKIALSAAVIGALSTGAAYAQDAAPDAAAAAADPYFYVCLLYTSPSPRDRG
mgnify:CR=1 FL=1